MSGHQTRENHNRPKEHGRCVPLRHQNVDRQAKIAVVLMALIPALACFYIGGMVSHHGNDPLPPSALFVILFCTALAAVSGYLILCKYAKNIGKLRQYVSEIATGTLPCNVKLEHTSSSDDLRCIEESLNVILKETEKRVNLIEEKLQVELGLRRALEQQQLVVLKAERHRVMLQSIGAACHHLGQPATALRMRLFLMKERATSVAEIEDINQSIIDIEAIESILKKLREVNEYRTERYLCESESDENHILAI